MPYFDFETEADITRIIIRTDFASEYAAILGTLQADDTGAAWDWARPAIIALADKVDQLTDQPFSTDDLESIIESMLEEDL